MNYAMDFSGRDDTSIPNPGGMAENSPPIYRSVHYQETSLSPARDERNSTLKKVSFAPGAA
jgi:hypothetical protein